MPICLVGKSVQGMWRQFVARFPKPHPVGFSIQECLAGNPQSFFGYSLNPGDGLRVGNGGMRGLNRNDGQSPFPVELVAERADVVDQAALASFRYEDGKMKARPGHESLHALRYPEHIARLIRMAQLPELVEVPPQIRFLRGWHHGARGPCQKQDLQRLEILELFIAHVLERDLLGFHRGRTWRTRQILQAGRQGAAAAQDLIARLLKHPPHLVAGEPADVGDVQQAFRRIREASAGEFIEQPEVARIGQADQHLRVFGQQGAQANQRIPWVVEMFQHVGQDHGVDGAGLDTLCGEVDVLQLLADHLVDPLCSTRGGRAIEFYAGDVGLGPGCFDQLPRGTRGTTHIQHAQRRAFHQGKQLLARMVVVRAHQLRVFRVRETLPEKTAGRALHRVVEMARQGAHERCHPFSGFPVHARVVARRVEPHQLDQAQAQVGLVQDQIEHQCEFLGCDFEHAGFGLERGAQAQAILVHQVDRRRPRQHGFDGKIGIHRNQQVRGQNQQIGVFHGVADLAGSETQRLGHLFDVRRPLFGVGSAILDHDIGGLASIEEGSTGTQERSQAVFMDMRIGRRGQ